jgi:coproporphyrinogen III oxidase
LDGSRVPDVGAVRAYLLGLQDRVCAAIEAEEEGPARFREDRFEGERGGLARPRVLEGGATVERAAASFSHTAGRSLPPAATARRPELAGRAYEAVSVSVIVHPRSPYAPASHMNVRLFVASREGAEPAWWFGGGFDLTPFYGFEEDAVDWHRAARAACEPLGPEAYPRLKKACDEYFFLKHRGEARGVGGIFFDDLSEGGFERCFELLRRVGDGYLAAYPPILRRRKAIPYGERERSFQLLRRGRYVEFNLVYDRGTLFGLQAGGRTDSILASLPPAVTWRTDWRPEPGSPEARLVDQFLTPRDWLGVGGPAGAEGLSGTPPSRDAGGR